MGSTVFLVLSLGVALAATAAVSLNDAGSPTVVSTGKLLQYITGLWQKIPTLMFGSLALGKCLILFG